jgi:hypothetical protein
MILRNTLAVCVHSPKHQLSDGVALVGKGTPESQRGRIVAALVSGAPIPERLIFSRPRRNRWARFVRKQGFGVREFIFSRPRRNRWAGVCLPRWRYWRWDQLKRLAASNSWCCRGISLSKISNALLNCARHARLGTGERFEGSGVFPRYYGANATSLRASRAPPITQPKGG